MANVSPTDASDTGLPIPGVFHSRGTLIALAFIVLVAALLRFAQISGPSLWLDEIWSIEMAMGRGSLHDLLPDGIIRRDQPNLTSLAAAAPWWNVWTHCNNIIHPPLYFIILRWWLDFTGTGPVGARGFSAFCSLAGILVLFDVCRLLHGGRAALLAAAIMAIASAQVDIGQDARSYPLLIFFGLSCCDVLIRIEKSGAAPARRAGLADCRYGANALFCRGPYPQSWALHDHSASRPAATRRAGGICLRGTDCHSQLGL
ncbi:MAG: glycosyltransferase family 39 protein [Planctomycetota bacterium]|nr:glycosyltransferase family 39 protein [Planctomycetota bacterium]